MQCPNGLFAVLQPKKECLMKNKGFTLIELMIVAAIVAMVAIMFLRSPQETGSKTSKLETSQHVASVAITLPRS